MSLELLERDGAGVIRSRSVIASHCLGRVHDASYARMIA